MERFARRRTLYVQRRFLISFVAFLFAFSLVVPALAEFLGPDRTTTQFVTVRDPDNDVWTLTHVDPLDPYADVCLIVHTCDEHPSVGRQTSLCGWVADNSGCSMAYKIEEQTVTLAEATISDGLQNCNLNNGWCTSSPTLHLTANEPLPGETITLIEGTRNGEAFACASATCDVPLVEGNNSFGFWALSSYGDSSQMGNHSAQVDTVPPNSAFGSPPEGSSVWVSGVLNMSGSSMDASSGVASAELSLDGGGSWQGLSLAGNSWGYSWDTGAVPDGSYQVLVRASDIAGHLESTASITVHVDQTAPSANLPDEWLIWEPVAIGASDGGSGVDAVEFTIHGGSFGVRKYQWSGGSVPGDFVWDRFFGSTVAPIGEYEVTLTVWDALGNSGSDSGTIVIPAPPTDEPEPTSIPPTEPPATSTPLPTPTSVSAGFIIISTATSEPAAAGSSTGSGGGPAAAPLDDSAAPAALADPEAASPTSGLLLWGGAALAAAAAATVYALSRRRAREAYIEQMRAQMAQESSSSARDRRLRSLRQRAEARIAPLRAALLAAAAATAATAAEFISRSNANGGVNPPQIQTESTERFEDHPRRSDLPTEGVNPANARSEVPETDLLIPGSLADKLPGFDLTPHSERQPIITFLNQELGAHSKYDAGAEANPTTSMSFDGFEFKIGGLRVGGGWENNRIGFSLQTPQKQELLSDGTVFSVGHSASVEFAWDGWNTVLDVSYSSVDFGFETASKPGASGGGSQGLYYTNKPVQGLVILVGVVVVGVAAYTLGPQGVDAVRQLGQQFPIPIPVP